MATGVHVARTLGDQEREDYKADLNMLKVFLGERPHKNIIDRYHKPILRKQLRDVLQRGR